MRHFFLKFSYWTAAIVITMMVQCAPLRAALYEDFSSLDNITGQQALTSFLEKMHQKSLDRGILNFVPASLFLVKKSQQALGTKDYERAEVLAKYAQTLSPDIPVVYIARGIAQWSKNKLYINFLIRGYIEAFAKEISPENIEDLCFFSSKNLFVITGAFLLTLCIFAALAALKYFTLAAHDLGHSISKAVPGTLVLGLTGVIFLFPLFLGLSAFWVCLCCLFILSAYHSRIERALIAGFALGCALLLPLLLAAASFSISVPQSDAISLLWKTNYGSWNQKDIEDLETLAAARPNDQDILLSLGLVNKREASYRTAQKYYERLIKISPRNYKAHTNMGNVLLATQKWDEAVARYQEAISLEPLLSAAAHFNFARAYQQKFMFREAEKELGEAKKIDRAMVDRYLKIYSENNNRMLIDELVPPQSLWNRGFQGFMQDQQPLKQAWDIFFLGIPFPYGPIAILVIFFFTMLAVKKERLRIASKCKMCGKPLCRRCQHDISAAAMCSQCQNFIKKQDNLGYKLKEDKIAGIKKYLKYDVAAGAVLSWLVPGAGHIWKGHPVKGIICLFVFFIVLLNIVSLLIFESPWEFIASLKAIDIVLSCLALALFWLLAGANAHRLVSKDMEDKMLFKNIFRDN